MLALRALVLSITALLAVAATSPAGLVFQLDPTAETFAFTGSDTGTPTAFSGAGRSFWTIPLALSSARELNTLIDTAISSTSGPSFSSNSFFKVQGNPPDPFYRIEINSGDAAEQTISGLGTPISYANFTAAEKIDLQNFVGSNGSFPLALGAGFASITTQVVPEPSTVALLVATLAFFAATLVRHQRD